MLTDSTETLAEKLGFLQTPGTYPDEPDRIGVIETHFAWVFLSRNFAYKLNKPIRFHELDYSTVDKRRIGCARGLVLNRRLAPRTYLETVPLTRNGAGLSLDGEGEPVDWLLKMRRLPKETMLDRRLTGREATRDELASIVSKLAAFYRETSVAPWTAEAYLAALRRSIMHYGEQLSALPAEIEVSIPDRLVAAQLGFIEARSTALAQRARRGHVVDAHGDLRPEHISLSDDPAIIDCIEFCDELRWLDTAEELGFLALECERLGRPATAARLLETYRRETEDFLDDRLLCFYVSRRALIRAVICAWHLETPYFAGDERRWIERMHWYLRAGLERIRTALD